MIDTEEITAAKLLGSLLLFTRVFFNLTENKPFSINPPKGREHHSITICRELTAVSRGLETRLLINLPPGRFKSTHVKFFIAWCLAKYPKSKFIYISHSSDLATMHTWGVRKILELPEYNNLFGVYLNSDSKAKDDFTTNLGGKVVAFGAKGSITGHDAGLPYSNEFSGGIIIDDIHKPNEVHSDGIRELVKKNYSETIRQRLRSAKVPIIFIGQRLHEDDLPANLINGFDGDKWKTVIIKDVDDEGNVLSPDIMPLEKLKQLEECSPYVYWSQHQQNPMPAGGALFKETDFVLLDEEPEILATFITCDTAETEKTYNDATAFSFFGVHRIKSFGEDTDIYGLHCIDCEELRVEPKELEHRFLQFYAGCMRHKIKPKFVTIEKKSTGVTLISCVKSLQGIYGLEIERSIASGSKGDRYIRIQPFISKRLISFLRYAKHASLCIEHLKKITANNTHRFDDIADTFVDAIQLALIDRVVSSYDVKQNTDFVSNALNEELRNLNFASGELWHRQ